MSECQLGRFGQVSRDGKTVHSSPFIDLQIPGYPDLQHRSSGSQRWI